MWVVFNQYGTLIKKLINTANGRISEVNSFTINAVFQDLDILNYDAYITLRRPDGSMTLEVAMIPTPSVQFDAAQGDITDTSPLVSGQSYNVVQWLVPGTDVFTMDGNYNATIKLVKDGVYKVSGRLDFYVEDAVYNSATDITQSQYESLVEALAEKPSKHTVIRRVDSITTAGVSADNYSVNDIVFANDTKILYKIVESSGVKSFSQLATVNFYNYGEASNATTLIPIFNDCYKNYTAGFVKIKDDVALNIVEDEYILIPVNTGVATEYKVNLLGSKANYQYSSNNSGSTWNVSSSVVFSDIVTLSTTQTITGKKTFSNADGVEITNGLKVNTNKFTVDGATGNVNSAGNITATGNGSFQNGTFSGTLNVTGAATFGSTVTLNADPTNPMEAATRHFVEDYVGGQVPTVYLKNATVSGDNRTLTIEKQASGVSSNITFTPAAPADMVTLSTAQTITGNKTFTGSNKFESDLDMDNKSIVNLTTGSATNSAITKGDAQSQVNVEKTRAEGIETGLRTDVDSNTAGITAVNARVDHIEATQNVVDMVAMKNYDNYDSLTPAEKAKYYPTGRPTKDLIHYDVTYLKVDDKIEVLHDETLTGDNKFTTSIYELTAKSGSTGTWTFIGSYSANAYTKEEANNKFLQLTGGTMAGNLDMGNRRLTGLSSPVNSTDAVNLQTMQNAVPRIEDRSMSQTYDFNYVIGTDGIGKIVASRRS